MPLSQSSASLSPRMICGFTTFSAFSLGTALLYERGQYLSMATYIAGSVALSILALLVGMALMRHI